MFYDEKIDYSAGLNLFFEAWQYEKFEFFVVIGIEFFVTVLVAWLFSKTYKTKKYGWLTLLFALIIPPASVLAIAVAFLIALGFAFVIAFALVFAGCHYSYWDDDDDWI